MHVVTLVIPVALLTPTMFPAGDAVHGGASLTGVGDLPGATFFSRSYGISADGTVVVGSSYSENGTTGELGCCEAFRWSADTGIVGLGDLEGSTFESRAHAVSGDGSIVVGRGHVGVTLGIMHDGALQALPELPGGGIGGATATGISGDGRWIVGSDAAENGREAFLYDRIADTIVGLGDLTGGIFRSDAEAISSDGAVVVGSSRAELGTEAFAWRAETGIVSLGELDGGTHLSIAYAVSSDGSVIVGSGASGNGTEAFLANDDGMQGLGDLDGGVFESKAWALSGNGTLVGGYATSALGREAVLWFGPESAPVRVRTLLEDAGVEVGAWFLDDVAAISTDGTTLTGFGTNPAGDREAWVAVLPVECPSDLDGSGATGIGDLLILLAAWGERGHPADLDGDGVVATGDLLDLLAAWGAC